MTSKSCIDGVIFDFDGVFVDSYACVYGAYNYMLDKMGFPKFGSVDDFRAFYSVDWKKNYYNLGILEEEEKNKAYNHIQEFIEANYYETPFFQDMVEITKKLEQKLGIASTGDSRVIKKKLEGTGLLEKIAFIVGGEMVTNIKPHPEPILLCAEKIGVSVDRIAYVGDTAIDIRAGRAAKVAKVIAVGWDGAYDSIDKLAKEKPDAILLAADELELFL